MKKSNHTTGQWTSSEYSNNDWGVYSEEGDGRDIALVRDKGEQTKANVKLIAAAPELLHNVKELLALLRFHGYNHSTEIGEAERLVYSLETEEETEPEKTLPFTSYSLQFVLGWEGFCDLTGVSYYAKKEGFEVKDSEIFNIPESKAKEFNLI